MQKPHKSGKPKKSSDKTFAEYREYVDRMLLFLRWKLRCYDYELTTRFSSENCEDDTDLQTIRAEIYVDTVYLTAKVTIYPAMYDSYLKGDLWKVGHDLCHEICHILTAPMQLVMFDDAAPSQKCYFQRVVEQQTERICQVMCDMLPDNWYEPATLKKLWP